MDQIDNVKKDITRLISANFGGATGNAFVITYQDEPLDMFTRHALNILSDLIGRPKAQSEIRSVFLRYHMEQIL